MRSKDLLREVASLLLLSTTRSLLRTRRRRVLTGLVGGAYLLVALIAGGMLLFQQGTDFLLIGPAPGSLLPDLAPTNWVDVIVTIVAPGLVLELSILAVLTMAAVAVAVGLGMSAALVLAGNWFRSRREKRTLAAGTGSVLTGLTPILLGLLTLGACCSTAAAGVAGFGALTQAGTASGSPLFTNLWALSAFQVGIVWVALVAQEQLFRIYTGGRAPVPSDSPAAGDPARPDLIDQPSQT